MQEAEFISIFIAPLESADIRYMVTGSIASTFYGEPRITHDIDVVLYLPSSQLDQFIALFPSPDYYCPPQEIIRIETTRETAGHFNLIHLQSGLKADCYPLMNEYLDIWGMQNRKQVKLGDEQSLWLAPPEYVITRKLEYFRQGGSQKHLSDIQKMVLTSQHLLDMSILSQLLHEKQLESFWDKIEKSDTLFPG